MAKSFISFTEASKPAQDLALARADFLNLLNEYIATWQPEIGRTRAIYRFLKLFNNGRIGEEIRQRLHLKSVKKRTFYYWRRRFKSKGLSGLLPQYSNGGCKIPSKVMEAIDRDVWENHLCRYQDVYEDLQVLFNKVDIPHYSTIRRYVKKYKAENWAALVLKHEGPKGLRDRGMAIAVGRKDANLTRPNQRWEIDTTIADLFTHREVADVVLITSDGKRCKIIGVIDVYPRMPKFYLVDKETGLIVSQVLRDRFLVWGLPDLVVIDNGGPYRNSRVLNFLKSANVNCEICIPGHPEQKPFIERVFRTVSEKLLRRLIGYSGNLLLKTRPSEIKIKYTQEKAQEIIDRYFDNVYAETVHRSTGQRPRERMRPSGFVPKTIDERELDILLMEECERKIHQGHITYQGGKYYHPRLPEGQKVRIKINDFDASEILVFIDRKFLCKAEDLTRKGKTPKEILDAKKERNRELRTRIKANEALIDKHKPRDASILTLIEHHEKLKPLELPKKADVIDFPELANIEYTRPETEEQNSKGSENKSEHEQPLIRNKREKYLEVRRRERAGGKLDDADLAFLGEFLISNEYRMIGTVLEDQLKKEAANEG